MKKILLLACAIAGFGLVVKASEYGAVEDYFHANPDLIADKHPNLNDYAARKSAASIEYILADEVNFKQILDRCYKEFVNLGESH